MKILVTGGTGSIGFPLACRLSLEHEVVILGRGEQGHYLARREAPHIQTVMDDVSTMVPSDYSGFDLVYHCAAMKHVGLCREFPDMAGQVNVVGTRNVLKIGAPVILLSTDKAVDPTTYMGMTKLRAEKLVLEAGGKVVRLCNVHETRGNLRDTARWCADQKITLNITELHAQRYWIGVQQAVKILLASMKYEEKSVVWPVAEPTTVQDYLEQHAPEVFSKYQLIGLQTGEKMIEDLCWPEENACSTRWEDHEAGVQGVNGDITLQAIEKLLRSTAPKIP